MKALPSFDPKARILVKGATLNLLMAALRARTLLVESGSGLERHTLPHGTQMKLKR